MDVLLINAPVKEMSQHASFAPPLGLAYIAAVLIQAGYSVSAIDFNVSHFHPIQWKRFLEKETPRILGISTHTETYLNGLRIARIAKQVNPETKVIMGGPHATVLYQDAAREKDVDVVVRGEGEYPMLELADYFIRNQGSLDKIKGIAYREDGTIKTNPERPFLQEPDELPFPARDLFPLSRYHSPGNILISRGGCPYRCRFCAVNSIWQGQRRSRRPEKVLEEIIYVLQHGQAREIAFADDTFTLNRELVVELCRLLKGARETGRLRWTCSSRVDLVDRELLQKMREAGCGGIQFGIEAGSQKILDSIGKRITLEQVKYAVSAALSTGIEVTCSFMFPHPEDTAETIREQKQLMKGLMDMGATLVLLAFTTPFPGTYYYQHADELGINILAKDWSEYDAKHLVITTKHLPEEKLESLLEELVNDVGMRQSTR